MTLQEAQNMLHAIYQGDSSVPSSTSGEWAYRTVLINEAVNKWANLKGVLWNELWTTLEDSLDGDKVTTDSKSYDMPSDFMFLGSFVDVGGVKYEVVSPDRVDDYPADAHIVFVSGNTASGYKLNFVSAPEAGKTIDYPYYKKPQELSKTTDVIEMPDPQFCIDWALYRMRSNDGDGQLAGASRAEALTSLEAMKTRNFMSPPNHANTPLDTQEGFGYGGLI